MAEAIAEHFERVEGRRVLDLTRAEAGIGEVSGLVVLDWELSATVRLDEPLESAWAVESLGGPSVACFGWSLLWIGQGEAQGVGAVLRSTEPQAVRAELDLAPGPSRRDGRRTLVVTLESISGLEREVRRIDRPTSLDLEAELEPGRESPAALRARGANRTRATQRRHSSSDGSAPADQNRPRPSPVAS